MIGLHNPKILAMKIMPYISGLKQLQNISQQDYLTLVNLAKNISQKEIEKQDSFNVVMEIKFRTSDVNSIYLLEEILEIFRNVEENKWKQ